MQMHEENGTVRIEAFSDGVFAIAMTLLVIEIKVPSHELVAGTGLARCLVALWPKLVALKGLHWTYACLLESLFMSLSEVHEAMKRALAARLYDDLRRMPIKKALEEYLSTG